jgi:hypothetical protein
MEAIELMVMQSEYHELPILWAECCIGPNAAIAAVKVDHSKISARRRCYPRLRVNAPSAKASRFITDSSTLVQTDYVPA